ncbi:unannotated protein [freshwater metagenome]|uniref:Unannotated protein n=1 Tax=freshwater metagenome TaxID=449393 RepID=A0A6J6NSG7_9ZZZZ
MHHRWRSGVVRADFEGENALCRAERVGGSGDSHAFGMAAGNPETLRGVPRNGVLRSKLRIDGEGILDVEGEPHKQVSQWFVDFVGIGHLDSPKSV